MKKAASPPHIGNRNSACNGHRPASVRSCSALRAELITAALVFHSDLIRRPVAHLLCCARIGVESRLRGCSEVEENGENPAALTDKQHFEVRFLVSVCSLLWFKPRWGKTFLSEFKLFARGLCR